MQLDKIVKAFTTWAPTELRRPYALWLDDPTTENARAFIRAVEPHKNDVSAALMAAGIAAGDAYGRPHAAVAIAVSDAVAARACLAGDDLSLSFAKACSAAYRRPRAW